MVNTDLRITLQHTYSRSSKVKAAPFTTVVDFREQLLRLSLNLPSMESSFAFGVHTAMFPGDLVPRVSTYPAAIYIHVNIDVYIAAYVNSYVRSGNRLPQCRCGSDRGQKRNSYLERDTRGCCLDVVSQVGGGGIIARSDIIRIFDLVSSSASAHFPTLGTKSLLLPGLRRQRILRSAHQWINRACTGHLGH